jgi:hypothetical protein
MALASARDRAIPRMLWIRELGSPGGRRCVTMAATVASLQNARMTSPSVTADAAWQPSPTLEEDDLILIRRVAAKDRQAFETLYHRYARRL